MNETRQVYNALVSAVEDWNNMKVFELDYYDGPVSGVMTFNECAVAYKFQMIDWNDNHEIRIFSVAALPSDALAEFRAILSQHPIDVPLSEYDSTIKYQRLRSILDRSGPIAAIIAWRTSDGAILVIREATDENRASIKDLIWWDETASDENWFNLLGLVR